MALGECHERATEKVKAGDKVEELPGGGTFNFMPNEGKSKDVKG